MESPGSAGPPWNLTRGVLACGTGSALSSPEVVGPVFMAEVDCKRLHIWHASG
jgi:hypothetical protein